MKFVAKLTVTKFLYYKKTALRFIKGMPVYYDTDKLFKAFQVVKIYQSIYESENLQWHAK